MHDDKATPISVNIDEACRLVGVRRSTIYKLVNDNKLRLVKIRRRSVIPFSDLEKLIADEKRAA